MFLGEFEHTIDDKGRLTIPAKYREHLSEGVVVTRGIEPCLELYPASTFLELAERVNKLSPTRLPSRNLRRLMYGGASDLPLDKQGRVNLPANLRSHAGIDSKVVIVGMFDHCEIWNPAAWQEYQEGNLSDPELRAEQFGPLDV